MQTAYSFFISRWLLSSNPTSRAAQHQFPTLTAICSALRTLYADQQIALLKLMPSHVSNLLSTGNPKENLVRLLATLSPKAISYLRRKLSTLNESLFDEQLLTEIITDENVTDAIKIKLLYLFGKKLCDNTTEFNPEVFDTLLRLLPLTQQVLQLPPSLFAKTIGASSYALKQPPEQALPSLQTLSDASDETSIVNQHFTNTLKRLAQENRTIYQAIISYSLLMLNGPVEKILFLLDIKQFPTNVEGVQELMVEEIDWVNVFDQLPPDYQAQLILTPGFIASLPEHDGQTIIAQEAAQQTINELLSAKLRSATCAQDLAALFQIPHVNWAPLIEQLTPELQHTLFELPHIFRVIPESRRLQVTRIPAFRRHATEKFQERADRITVGGHPSDTLRLPNKENLSNAQMMKDRIELYASLTSREFPNDLYRDLPLEAICELANMNMSQTTPASGSTLGEAQESLAFKLAQTLVSTHTYTIIMNRFAQQTVTDQLRAHMIANSNLLAYKPGQSYVTTPDGADGYSIQPLSKLFIRYFYTDSHYHASRNILLDRETLQPTTEYVVYSAALNKTQPSHLTLEDVVHTLESLTSNALVRSIAKRAGKNSKDTFVLALIEELNRICNDETLNETQQRLQCAIKLEDALNRLQAPRTKGSKMPSADGHTANALVELIFHLRSEMDPMTYVPSAPLQAPTPTILERATPDKGQECKAPETYADERLAAKQAAAAQAALANATAPEATDQKATGEAVVTAQPTLWTQPLSAAAPPLPPAPRGQPPHTEERLAAKQAEAAQAALANASAPSLVQPLQATPEELAALPVAPAVAIAVAQRDEEQEEGEETAVEAAKLLTAARDEEGDSDSASPGSQHGATFSGSTTLSHPLHDTGLSAAPPA